MLNDVLRKNSFFFKRNIFYYSPKLFTNKTRISRTFTKNNNNTSLVKKNSRVFFAKKTKKYSFRSNYLFQKKNYHKFKNYKLYRLSTGNLNYGTHSQYSLHRSFYNFKFNRSRFFYETRNKVKKEKKTLINAINTFKIIDLNDFFFKNTLFNCIFTQSSFFLIKFNLVKENNVFLLSKNLQLTIGFYLNHLNLQDVGFKSFKFFFNFFHKSEISSDSKHEVIFKKLFPKNLNKLIFFNNNVSNINLQKKPSGLINFFFKSSFIKIPLGSANIIYYFISHAFQSKSVILKKKSKLTAHPMEDFNSSTRDAFTYCVSVSLNKKIDGEDSMFKYFRVKKKKFSLTKASLFLTNIRKTSALLSFNKKSSLISNFFFFLGRKENAIPKWYYAEFSKSIVYWKKKTLKKNLSLNPALTSCFFFNSFLFSSIFFKKKNFKKQRFFKVKKSFYFQPLFDNFLTNTAIIKSKGINHPRVAKHYFKNNAFNMKNIQTYGLFLSTKEIFFFIFSKPFFFKFFFWNFKNTYKKNFLYYNSISFYFENLYKSFFQLNKNFKYSNVIPYRTCFLFKYKRVVLKEFSIQIFNPALTSFFYANVASFLEYCSGKKVMLNTNSFLITYLDFEERATCALWTPRIRIFRKMLGPRLFLNESLTILYICIKLKDPYLLSAWMLNMFYKISFWKYKLLFRYLYYVLKYFMWASFANKCIKGLRFQLKGKVSVAGNARTRTIFTSIGATGNGNLNKRVLTNLKLLRTFTGVIGFRTWLSF